MCASVREAPRILPRSEHSISRRNIEINAIKVLYRLHHAGFKSYVVGGAVRDLMLEKRPKDFDISTDARPQQIRRLFRNSRIIGRRFRLAHIYFRDGIIEVSTFRRGPDPEAQAAAPGELLITDDNVFGTPEEDAARRDFTINALFYNIGDFSVIDYVGGIEDLEKRLIRTIGDPDVRFQEDPVRMLRACELAGRLDLTIERKTEAAVRRQRKEIEKAASARLADEVSQILHSGSCESILRVALNVGLLKVVLPESHTLLTAEDSAAAGFARIPETLDSFVQSGRDLGDTVALSSLLLPLVALRSRAIEKSEGRPLRRSALRSLITQVVDSHAVRFALPRGKAEGVYRCLWTFHRLGDRFSGVAKRVQFSRQPGFDEALDLMDLVVATTGEGRDGLDLWRRIQMNRPQPASPTQPSRRRRRPRRRSRGRARR